MNYYDKNNELVCIHIKKISSIKTNKFFTANEIELQAGLLNFKKNSNVQKHIHLERNLPVKFTTEVVYILKGSSRIDLYDKNKLLIESFKATKGDLIIFIKGGHGLTFNRFTRIFEVKQGPYIEENDKEKF